MGAADLRILLFEAVEDGFLIAFTGSDAVFSFAIRAVVGLDPWQRRWIASERIWWVSQDAISRLARRIPALAEALEQWHQRTPSIEDNVNSFYANIRQHTHRHVFIPRDIQSAYRVLNLPPGAPAEDVAAARRTLARQYHPDAGGGHAMMVSINLAADSILRWLHQEAKGLPV
ncbi:MAG TPA: hypothetical protein VF040_03690 [Ktedonobacterales bacterium]